jgi:hypothetical protein
LVWPAFVRAARDAVIGHVSEALLLTHPHKSQSVACWHLMLVPYDDLKKAGCRNQQTIKTEGLHSQKLKIWPDCALFTANGADHGNLAILGLIFGQPPPAQKVTCR